MSEQVGTNTSFNLPVDEIIELALEGIGGEHISNKEAKLARTSLNLIFIDLQNKGFAPLASMELQSVTLVSGSSEGYSMDSSVFNVMDAVIEVSSSSGRTDLPLTRIGYTDWLNIPNKATQGRPSQFMVDRQSAAIALNVWPQPDAGNYKFKTWTVKRIADVDKSYQLIDLPHRYLPAIVRGLRYYMADLRGVDLNERTWLKNEYFEALQAALDEDREKIDFIFYPQKARLT